MLGSTYIPAKMTLTVSIQPWVSQLWIITQQDIVLHVK